MLSPQEAADPWLRSVITQGIQCPSFCASPNQIKSRRRRWFLSFLRVVFSYVVEWQLADSNPCVGIRRHEEAKRKRYLTDKEFDAIRANAHPRLQIVMDLLFLTGQRVVDVLRIKRSDITDRDILFEQQKTKAKLLVRWSPQLREAVSAANTLNGNVLGLNLFRTLARSGKPPSYGVTKDQWNETCSAANIKDAHIHDIRAKSLTDAKRQGNSLLGTSRRP